MDQMSIGHNTKTNLNSEMSDLVHQAEEWAEPRADERVARIGKQILTRAAVLLLEQLGIKTEEQFQTHFGAVLKKTEPENHQAEQQNNLENNELSQLSADFEDQRADMARSPVSPMTLEEFKSALSNSMLDEPLTPSPSPFGKRRTSMLAAFTPMSPIFSENSLSPEKKKTTSSSSQSKSTCKTLFPVTSTPKSQDKRQNDFLSKRSNSMPMTPSSILAVKKTTSSPKVTLAGETPLENRASRLRRMKLEETLSFVNTSMNSTRGWN